MSQSFYDMMYLFACGATGKTPEIDHKIDVRQVYQQSMVQAVWHTVFLGLKMLYDQKKLEVPHEVMQGWQQEVQMTVLRVNRRQVAVNHTIQSLEKEGIKCCMLKGTILSDLYDNPSCRISSDTDLLIEPKLEKRAVNSMKSLGFDVERRAKSSNQTVCRSKEAGTIELHISLNNRLMDDIWFRQQDQQAEKMRVFTTKDGETYHTLGVTDGLIFTTLHLIKHFINRAGGIRLIMDTLLYIKHYRDEIDWKRFDGLMRELKYDKFMDLLYAIGTKYLFFTELDLGKIPLYQQKLVDKVLSDMEEGGLKGFHSIEQLGFYNLYSAQRYKNLAGEKEYERYQKKAMLRDYRTLIFLDKKEMKKKYTYLNKYEFLLPVAWIQRIFNIVFQKVFHRTVTVDLEAKMIIDKRMELIRELDMI